MRGESKIFTRGGLSVLGDLSRLLGLGLLGPSLGRSPVSLSVTIGVKYRVSWGSQGKVGGGQELGGGMGEGGGG